MATAGGWGCVCSKANPKTARYCGACGSERAGGGASSSPAPWTGQAATARDPVCGIHKCALDVTGFCEAAQAWWYPRFRCPICSGPLASNGYCGSCTPRRHVFPGDYFEAVWTEDAGPEWGHYVRGHTGPTPALTEEELRRFMKALKAYASLVGRAVGQVPPEEPAWIHEGAGR